MFKSFSAINIKLNGVHSLDRTGYVSDSKNSNGVSSSHGVGSNTKLQRSYSLGNCIVEKTRGFKPSDRYDPNKRHFLIELSKQIWHKKNESTNGTKKIDLQKLFTPATDVDEIQPKNRKLYASSAFYSPSLHPTVEDQVELARRISNSLSDISNKKSKGQSMYVNRKKRSVKWVHEGCSQDGSSFKTDYEEEYKENDLNDEEKPKQSTTGKIPLKLLMNPKGQMLDITSQESLNTQTGLLSPENCAELVKALQTQRGKGAELFAKRRKKSEKWVVDETNTGTQSSSGILDYQQYQPKPPTSPSVLSAYSDAGKHRVQLNMHQEQVLEKYAKPGLKVIKTPWEAALETGSASTAFVEEQSPSSSYIISRGSQPPTSIYQEYQPNLTSQSPIFGMNLYDSDCHSQYNLPKASQGAPKVNVTNSQRELAYKPSIPRGWKGASVSLPKELYIPKEIPLESYAPPPQQSVNISQSSPVWKPSNKSQNFLTPEPYELNHLESSTHTKMNSPNDFNDNSALSGFRGLKGSGFDKYAPLPKQQYMSPTSYQKNSQNINQNVSQINYNPGPLSYSKLAKFENIENKTNYHDLQHQTPLRCRSPFVSSPRAFNSNASPSGVSFNSNLSQNFEQNFNNSARGWKASGTDTVTGIGNLSDSFKGNTFANICGSLPFTDF